MPFQHTLLLGPVIFFYVQSLLNPAFKFGKNHWLHFFPGLLYILWNIIVAVTDRVILKKYFLMDGQNDPDFQTWYVGAGLLSILLYLLLSLRYYQQYRKFIVQELSFADTVTYKWVRNFLIACFIYFFSSLLLNILYEVGIDIQYTDSWWYYLLFALLFYYIAITGYSNSLETKVKYELDFLRYQPPLQLTNTIAPTTPHEAEDASFEVLQSQTIAPQQPQVEDSSQDALSIWKEPILKAVVTEKQYQNPELTLTDLAKHLGTNPSFLSKVINQYFQNNFNDFINNYRVEEVKQKLMLGAASQVTIMSIAYDAGFNSKATFNRAFKKATGKSPKDFLANMPQ